MASMRTRKRRAVHSRSARLYIKCVLMLRRGPDKLEKLIAAVVGHAAHQPAKEQR